MGKEMTPSRITDSRVDAAIALVARDLVSCLDVDEVLEWEDTPLIGEDDFERVCEAARRLLVGLRPPRHGVIEAYDLLESRAEQ